jgi:phosphoribosylformylglycinamidine synthase
MSVRAIVLRTAGTNCDAETVHAMELAGAEVRCVHLNRVLESPGVLEEFAIAVVPGGFSYGDDIAAGRIFAAELSSRLGDALRAFVRRGRLLAGICNGFQVLVKTDLLPGATEGSSDQTATLTHNSSGRFVDRWVRLRSGGGRCVWTRGIDALELPVAHGEGRFVCASAEVGRALDNSGQVALRYATPAENPNGSDDDIAGVCDASGLVFGLMPHPERYVSPYQHYAWTTQADLPAEGAGLAIFRNAVDAAKAF